MSDLPTVAGRSMDRTIADFERSCCVLLGEEQRKPNPDNALIGVLCDAVRLGREYSDSRLRMPGKDAESSHYFETLDEADQHFALYDDAIRRGTKLWRAERPEDRAMRLPDTAKLVAWLIALVHRAEAIAGPSVFALIFKRDADHVEVTLGTYAEIEEQFAARFDMWSEVYLARIERGPRDVLERIIGENAIKQIGDAPTGVLRILDGPFEYGEPLGYLTDDRDVNSDRRRVVWIQRGGNGDWYVSVTGEHERPFYGARLCTSGGSASRVPGMTAGIADAYDAMRKQVEGRA